MIILAINVGNSEITIGAFSEGGELRFSSAIATLPQMTRDQYAITLSQLLEFHSVKISSVEGGIISSVVPSLTETLAQAVKVLLGRYPIVVGPGVKTGLNILIEDPAELGSDIVACASAAVQKHKAPIILVDIGTATVISAIDINGSYLGCSICPGIKLSYDALATSTAQLPQIGIKMTSDVIGKNSSESMMSGVVYGSASMIDGVADEIEKVIGKAVILATGNLAPVIIQNCKHEIIYEENLLLEGLFLICSKNSQKPKRKQT